MKDTFDYNAATGELIWKSKGREAFKSSRDWRARNSLYAGRVAGTQAFHMNGTPMTIQIKLNGKFVKAHRIIWEMFNAPIPDGLDIDHINGDPFDNRLCNLRLATRSQNLCNRGKARANTSGFKGVGWSKGAWRARIMLHRKEVDLGRFSTPELAYAAYCDAASKHHGAFAKTH